MADTLTLHIWHRPDVYLCSDVSVLWYLTEFNLTDPSIQIVVNIIIFVVYKQFAFV
jgi:hypothetical protein